MALIGTIPDEIEIIFALVREVNDNMTPSRLMLDKGGQSS